MINLPTKKRINTGNDKHKKPKPIVVLAFFNLIKNILDLFNNFI